MSSELRRLLAEELGRDPNEGGVSQADAKKLANEISAAKKELEDAVLRIADQHSVDDALCMTRGGRILLLSLLRALTPQQAAEINRAVQAGEPISFMEALGEAAQPNMAAPEELMPNHPEREQRIRELVEWMDSWDDDTTYKAVMQFLAATGGHPQLKIMLRPESGEVTVAGILELEERVASLERENRGLQQELSTLNTIKSSGAQLVNLAADAIDRLQREFTEGIANSTKVHPHDDLTQLQQELQALATQMEALGAPPARGSSRVPPRRRANPT